MKSKNSLKQIEKQVRKVNEIHLEETARLVKELGGYGVGSGFEIGNIPCIQKAETPQEYRMLALADSIRSLWADAGGCYKNRRFRACVILLACLVEALISMELMRKKKFTEEIKEKTLGQLINYCEKKGILLEILKDMREINEFRKIAIHLLPEKSIKEESDFEVYNEIVPLEEFKSPPARISQNGWISGDDVEITLFPRPAIKYKYKKLAGKMYAPVQSILKTLYGLEFKFEFKGK